MRASYLYILLSCVVLTEGQYCFKTRRKSDGIRTETYIDCCKGYTWFKRKCTALCATLCVNADCTAPDVCTCKPGYGRVDDFRCEKDMRLADSTPQFGETTIEFDSKSEITTELNLHIDSNYLFNTATETETSTDSESMTEFENVTETSQESCDPEKNCKLGKCMENRCQCDENYKLENGKCEPQCIEKCVNSTCVKPNLCACSEGFTGSSCKLVCNDEYALCINGTYNEPGSCRCFEGFIQNLDDYLLCTRGMYIMEEEGLNFQLFFDVLFKLGSCLIVSLNIFLGVSEGIRYAKKYRVRREQRRSHDLENQECETSFVDQSIRYQV